MTKIERKTRRKILEWHKGIGLILGLPLIFTVVTGIILQYPQVLERMPENTTAIVVDPQQPAHWLRGTNYGLYHSFDQGITWQEAPLMWSPGSIRRLVFSIQSPNRVYALGANALLVSEDSGRIWELLEFETNEAIVWDYFIDISLDENGDLLVLTNTGLLSKQNQSQEWFVQNLNPDKSNSNIINLVHDLHTGHWFELAGPGAITATALGSIFLILSGFSLVTKKRKSERKRND